MGGSFSSYSPDLSKLKPKINPFKSFQKIAGKEMNKEFSNRLQTNINGKSAAKSAAISNKNTTAISNANTTAKSAANTTANPTAKSNANFINNNNLAGGSRKKNKKYKKSRT